MAEQADPGPTGSPPWEQAKTTVSPTTPSDPPAGGGPLATHPMTSLLIGLLVTATIVIPLVVPIYARITPKVGDFPFFYFFLLAFMPVVALALWVVTLLQRRLNSGRLDNPKGGQR
jgi:hypothetical protein